MIQTKEDLLFFLEQDRKALSIARKSPRMFADEVWKFQRSLRRLEYLTNTHHTGGVKFDY